MTAQDETLTRARIAEIITLEPNEEAEVRAYPGGNALAEKLVLIANHN